MTTSKNDYSIIMSIYFSFTLFSQWNCGITKVN